MAKDPYEYFRIEAREILEGLGRGVLALEKETTPEVVGTLLRLAHTLKGAARVVRLAATAEKAHAIEDAVAPLREAGAVIAPDRIDHLLKLLDGIAADVAAVDRPAPPTPAAAAPAAAAPTPPLASSASTAAAPAPGEELGRTVRVDLKEMDGLLESIAEAGVQVRALRRVAGTATRARQVAERLLDPLALQGAWDPARPGAGAAGTKVRGLAQELAGLVAGLERGLTSAMDQAERQLSQVRDAAEGLRLLPASTLFAPLERTARDVVHSLGKQVDFTARGGDVRVDADVLGIVQGALVQMVRNAVAHGIEPPAQRRAAAKPPLGRVELEVVRRGSRVVFVCRDDGRGIDLEAVRRVAQGRGVSGVQSLNAEALLRLLLKGGLTTSGAVTEVSGRGIGLDILRAAATRLGGEVTVDTQQGRGTSLGLSVPVSLSSLEALLVEAGGVAAAIPLEAVRATVRLEPDHIARSPGGESIAYQGQAVPFAPLAGPLGGKAGRGDARRWTAVIIAGASGLGAVGVDRLVGTATVVMRPLPALAPADPLVAGAAMDGEGTPQLVLDADGVVAAVARAGSPAGAGETRAAATVLVIDDSLTTRMLEQSILESAGYEVDLATSAEEGMEKARRRRYQLFLVDVEMPGMDGYTFVERTRADPALRDVPAILVTSRGSAEDRQRGADAGAHAYIVKGDFDQGLLLETIARLVR